MVLHTYNLHLVREEVATVLGQLGLQKESLSTPQIPPKETTLVWFVILLLFYKLQCMVLSYFRYVPPAKSILKTLRIY